MAICWQKRGVIGCQLFLVVDGTIPVPVLNQAVAVQIEEHRLVDPLASAQ